VTAGLFFTASGQSLVAASRGQVALWDVPTRRRRWIHSGSFIGLSTDGTTCLIRTKSRLRAWHVLNGQEIDTSQIATQDFPYHQRVTLAATSTTLVIDDLLDQGRSQHLPVPDAVLLHPPAHKSINDRFALIRCVDRISEISTLVCYDIERSGVLCTTASRASGRYLLATCPQRQLVIIAEAGTIQLFQAATGELWYAFQAPAGRLGGVALHPHKPRTLAVAVGTSIHMLNTIHRSLRLTSGVGPSFEEAVLTTPEPIGRLAFSPSGDQLAYTTAKGAVYLWDLTTQP
jgi:WD40 repeat protein